MKKNQNFHLIEYVEYVSPDGKRYPMFGGNKSLVSWEGAGVPEIDYIVDSGPFQNGLTVRDYRYQSRNVTFGLHEAGSKRKNFYKSQKKLVDAARPTRSVDINPGYVKVWLEDGTQKEIEARLSKGPMGDWGGRENGNPFDMMERITFFCPDPFWRNVDQSSVSFSSQTQDQSCLSDSLCFPFCVSTTSIVLTQNIVYTGTWFGDQFDIVITGPLSNPSIVNTTTGKNISLNYDIIDGEVVTISIDRNKESISSSLNGNIIGTVKSL
jgi:hypothetical protein